MSDEVDAAAGERAVYVHIPFCHRRCPYCDFAVVDMSSQSSPIDRYLAALATEVAMSDPWGPLHAVNIGGGTPSVLAPHQIGQLLNSIRERFGWVDGAEISLEANPEDITGDYAGQLRIAGVNRISLGVQSFDAAVLDYLGRDHSPAQAVAAVHGVAAAGMDTVNVDLIFGTPQESLESWEETVRTALGLGVDHLSAYALTVERGTDLSRAVSEGAAAPDTDDQADKYEALVELVGTTLDHYEVSNWARPGHRCRYNLNTWAQGEYLAFGLGAHGHRAGVRSRNYRRLDAYLSQVESGQLPVQSAEQLGEWDREKERVFLGLRRRAGVAVGAAGTALVSSPVGQRFLDAGVITIGRGRLIVAKPLLTDAVSREVLALELPPT
jgi:oxygen-independent coproporphyrinogen-3 oxidase